MKYGNINSSRIINRYVQIQIILASLKSTYIYVKRCNVRESSIFVFYKKVSGPLLRCWVYRISCSHGILESNVCSLFRHAFFYFSHGIHLFFVFCQFSAVIQTGGVARILIEVIFSNPQSLILLPQIFLE